MTIAIIIGVLIVVGLIAIARIFKNMHAGEVAKEETKRKEALLDFRKWRREHRRRRGAKDEPIVVPSEPIKPIEPTK